MNLFTFLFGYTIFLSQSLVPGLILDYSRIKRYPFFFSFFFFCRQNTTKVYEWWALVCWHLRWRKSESSIFSSRQISLLDIIAHAIFSTRDIGPLKKEEMLHFWQLLPSTDWNNKNKHEAVWMASAYNVICMWFSLLLQIIEFIQAIYFLNV